MCSPSDPLSCLPPTGPEIIAARGVQSGIDALAKAISEGVATLVRNTVAWWIEVPAIDIANESSVVFDLRGYVLPVAIFVAVAGVMWAGIRMALSRKADPMIDVGRGLFAMALWSAIGVALPATALEGSDALSTWIIDSAAGRDFGTRMTAAFAGQIGNPGLVIVIGILAIIAALIQSILMMFREGAVLILAGVVVLAASGQVNAATRPWLPKVTGWGAALIAYKPAAAMVYATGFTLIGENRGVRSMFLGFAVLIMSILALPALMKFFSWAVGSIGDGGGGGLGAGLAAAGGGLHAASWLGGGRDGHNDDSAASHARFIQQSLGPQNGRGGDAGGGPSGASPVGGLKGSSPPPASAPPAPPTAGGGATSGAATTSASTAGSTAATSSTAGVGAGAAGGGAGAATAGAAAGAGAVAGPVGVGVAVAGQAVYEGAKKGAGRAGDAMGGSS